MKSSQIVQVSLRSERHREKTDTETQRRCEDRRWCAAAIDGGCQLLLEALRGKETVSPRA